MRVGTQNAFNWVQGFRFTGTKSCVKISGRFFLMLHLGFCSFDFGLVNTAKENPND
jgi:hypothetical protein